MIKQRLLVTGATGFIGSWTLRYWEDRYPNIETWATSEKPNPQNLYASEYRQVDLCDLVAVREVVLQCQPSQVIHLAGLVGKAGLEEYIRLNVVGTKNLYNALAEIEHPSDLRIIQASSASIYGLVQPEELPISEEQPLRPVASYGLSKAAQDLLAVSVGHSIGLKIIRACIFNTLGPGQVDGLVPMVFIRQLMNSKAGLLNPLKVGNTETRRDFVDVRDIVAAFDVLLHYGEPGHVYNVASGEDISIQEIIDQLSRIVGIELNIKKSADRISCFDVPSIRADITKIYKKTGWRPKITFPKSLEDMCISCGLKLLD
jgi:GDP-4-dehydro-6-deoxy-D-mannose reductase